MSYKETLNINNLDFHNKRILIIGASWMADQYCKAFSIMGIEDVSVVSKSVTSSINLCQKHGYRPYHDGYELNCQKLGEHDLVVIATPIHELIPAAKCAVASGNKNILIEKPGSLYSAELLNWADELKGKDVRVRVAYNRLTYPNFIKLKDLIQSEGGITSCRYTFTELLHTINFDKNRPDAYERWGISNSLHVISMAHDLIGMPKELNALQSGYLEWHPSGDRFVGSGITESNIPFSYHADWNSAGRWGIEVMTKENAYRLMPLEQIFRCKRGTFEWEKVNFEVPYAEVKQGIAEEVAIMFYPQLEESISLMTLNKAASFTRLAELIFNYTDK